MKKREENGRNFLTDRGNQDSSDWIALPKFNHWPHVFNLTNCIVGVSVLAMPYCLQQCGILLGIILICLCSVLTKITCHLLYRGAVLTRSRNYELMASHAFGSCGKHLVELLMILYLMSSVVSFMVVIGDIGPHILADYLELQAPTQRLRILVMVLVVIFVVLPLSLFRSINSLSGISSITVFFYGIFVLRMLIECFPRIFDSKWSTNIYWWRHEGLLNSFPIISMALSCQTQLFCITDCIQERSIAKVDVVVSGAINICSIMYTAVGIFGYVAFHDVELHGDILLYLQSSFLTQLMKLGFMLSVAVSIPLMLFPSRIAFYNLFLKPDAGEFVIFRIPSIIFVSLTMFLLFFSLLLAIIVPNVEFVLGLTGAVIGSLVTIIIPSVLFLIVSRDMERNRLLAFYAKISIVIGLFMLVGSTWTVLHTEQEPNVVDVILPKQINNELMENAIENKPKDKFYVNDTKLEDISAEKKRTDKVRLSWKKDHEQKLQMDIDGNEKAQKMLNDFEEKHKKQKIVLETGLENRQPRADEVEKRNKMFITRRQRAHNLGITVKATKK